VKIAAIIEARMSSSRLPGKVMKCVPDTDTTLIQLMVERLRDSLLLDDVIVATTVSKNDDVLCQHLDILGISYYRGSEENVLQRVLDTALRFGVDIIVEVTGDCPILDPIIVDQSIGFFYKSSSDYVGNTCITDMYPRGQDVKVFATSVLSAVNVLTQDADDREHVSLYIYNNRDKFKCTPLPKPPYTIPEKTRLTVDYPEDLHMVLTVLENLGHNCTLRDICSFLTKNSNILEINGNLGVSYINDDTRHDKAD